MKHQQHFLASLESIESGEEILNDLAVTLESYEQADRWLTTIEAGDTSVIPQILAVHGHEIEGVSMEGVQVHINSNQVQMIVDFLKKWIPRLLNFLRDLLGRVIKWVREKLLGLETRLHHLKTKTWGNKQVKIQVRGVSQANKAAAVLIHERKFDSVINTVDDAAVKKILGNLEEWAYVTGKRDSNDWANMNPAEADHTAHLVQDFVRDWLNFGNNDLPYAQIGRGHAGELLLAYANGLDAPSVTFNQAVDKIADRFQTTVYILVESREVMRLIDQLNTLQMKLLGTSRSLSRLVDDAMDKLRAHERNTTKLKADQTVSDDLTKLVRASVKLINYMYTASGVGLQGRLSLLGNAVGMLEKAEPAEH